MIHNFPELVVLLDLYYRKIPPIRTAIRYAEWRENFKKMIELKDQEQLIRKKIIRAIAFYKAEVSNNYLENKIYGNQLCELETYFEKFFQE